MLKIVSIIVFVCLLTGCVFPISSSLEDEQPSITIISRGNVSTFTKYSIFCADGIQYLWVMNGEASGLLVHVDKDGQPRTCERF